jgi:sulfur transfer protein SufE/stress-induced morphogen
MNSNLEAVRYRQKRCRILCAATGTDLPVELESIVASFQAVPDPMQRYKQLLFYATKLQELPKEFKVEQNKVKGCVSQVWVGPSLQEDGTIIWRADSDSQLTKGLAALLVQGLSGSTPEDILKIKPDFITDLGLQQSLTPSRNNGFLNMFKLMQAKALELLVANTSSNSAPGEQSNTEKEISETTVDESKVETKSSNTPVANSLRKKLEAELSPTKLSIIDESSKHAGHADRMGSAGASGETHFAIEIVSNKFSGLTSIKRHRLVYSIIDEEMGNPVHALSLVTKTPEEV